MHEPGQAKAPALRSRLEESRGGWALFGRLLVWSTRNNRQTI